MKYKLIYTTKFKKDYKLSIKRGMPIELVKEAITLLQDGQPLPSIIPNITPSNCQQSSFSALCIRAIN